MTSKLVNKGSVMGNTLKERVDQLIAKSNQELPSNQGGNPSSHSTNRASYMRGPRPKRNGNSNFQKPRDDICQHLWGPEPSTAGPFDGSDGSRLIQCFRCRRWGHPKRLCPSRLNYTRGVIQGPPSQKEDRQPENPPPKNPLSSAIDVHISREGQRYHNPDPLLRLIGPANEASIIIEGQWFSALVDSEAQLSTMSELLVPALKLPIHKLNTLIQAEVSGGEGGGGVTPYTGYIEA